MKSKSSLVTLLAPYGLWSFVFILIPLLIIFLYSLCQRGVHGELQWIWTLENFGRVFDPLYLKIVRNSLILAVVNTCGCLLLGYPMAYYMAFSRRETKMVLLFLIMIPFWTSFVVRIYAWVVLLGESGIINQFLLKLEIISTPLPFLFRAHSILLGLLYNYLPFMILPIFVTLERLDPTLLEAAQDLGTTSARRFFRVTLPLSSPGIMAGALLVFIPSLGEFVIPEILGGGKYPMIGNLIAMQYLTHRDWPFGSALSLLLTLVVLIGLLLTRGRGTKGGLVAAAV